MPSNKCSTPIQFNDNEQFIKRTKRGPLEDEKQKLHHIIDIEPNKRIYQIDKNYKSFKVATAQGICEKYIQDGATHVNILEYYFGTMMSSILFPLKHK